MARYDPHACSLAHPAPNGCHWCGRSLNKRQRRWCSVLCRRHFERNHIWSEARAAALQRDGFQCVRCGRQDGLEVNHIVPLAFTTIQPNGKYRQSCEHHLSNLETLCKAHHREATNDQRAKGLLGGPNARRPRP